MLPHRRALYAVIVIALLLAGSLIWAPAPAETLLEPTPACGERVYVGGWWPNAWYVEGCEWVDRA